MTSTQESLSVYESLKKKVLGLFDTIQKSLKEEATAKPSQQELLGQLFQLKGLISELIDNLEENLDKNIHLETQVEGFKKELSDLQKRVKELEGSDLKLFLGQLAFKLE